MLLLRRNIIRLSYFTFIERRYLFKKEAGICFNSGDYGASWIYLHNIFVGEWGELLTILSAVGFILTVIIRRRPKELAVYLFPVFTFAILSSKKVNFVRNLIPIMPFMAFWAAFACRELWRQRISRFILKGSRAKGITMVLIFVLICVLPYL